MRMLIFSIFLFLFFFFFISNKWKNKLRYSTQFPKRTHKHQSYIQFHFLCFKKFIKKITSSTNSKSPSNFFFFAQTKEHSSINVNNNHNHFISSEFLCFCVTRKNIVIFVCQLIFFCYSLFCQIQRNPKRNLL